MVLLQGLLLWSSDRQGQGSTIQVDHEQRRKQGPAPEINGRKAEAEQL